MDSKALVELAMKAQSLSQKELAVRLGVSPTQVSQWKNDDDAHMSYDMQERLTKLAGIGELDPRFVQLAGSIKDAKKWRRLILHLADQTANDNASQYVTEPLQADTLPDFLCWQTFDTLNEMGVSIPKPFPKELDFNYALITDPKTDDWMELSENLHHHPFVQILDNLFEAYAALWGFYMAYIFELGHDNDMEDIENISGEIDASLIRLAATKIEIDETVAPNLRKFIVETRKDYKKWLSQLKQAAVQHHMPMRAEFMDLLNESHEELSLMAEMEIMGSNEDRLHPDIYMNELLGKIRAIYEALPKIMKKLDIKLDDDSEETPETSDAEP